MLAGIALELLAVFGTEPLIARITGTYPDLSDFRPPVGNPKLLLRLQIPNRLMAAFGEETSTAAT